MKQILSMLYISDKKFYQMVASIAIPIALQSLITTGVNMMDTLMISALGETSLSGVSLANQFISIYQGCCMGIGMGASVMISRYYGMKEPGAMRKTLSIMLRICFGLAAVFALLTFLFPNAIMYIYTTEEAVISQGEIYLRWSVITYFLLGLSLTCTLILRSIGKTKLPLYTSIAAFFLNVGCNYIFIFGKLGMPAMGVAGAAIGTLIARLLEFTVICGYLFYKDEIISFRLKHLFMKTGDLWKEYVHISLPVIVSDMIFMLGSNAVTMIIGRLGESFVAAVAVTSVTQQLSSVVTQGMAQAAAIVTGYALGEGKREKAQKQGFALLGLGIAFGILACMIIMLLSDFMISVYHVSDVTAQIAEQLMRAVSITMLFQAINSIMTKGTLRGGGDTKMLMITDNVFLWICSIPLGVLAGFVLHLPAFWIYIFLNSDQIIKAVWCVFRLRSGKWIKKIAAA